MKPAFDDFILPTKKYADIIIPRGGDNHVAIDLIVQHIRTKLGQHDLCKIYPNLYVIQSTFQVYQLFLFAIIIYCGCGCLCVCMPVRVRVFLNSKFHVIVNVRSHDLVDSIFSFICLLKFQISYD